MYSLNTYTYSYLLNTYVASYIHVCSWLVNTNTLNEFVATYSYSYFIEYVATYLSNMCHFITNMYILTKYGKYVPVCDEYVHTYKYVPICDEPQIRTYLLYVRIY